jgi:hypothetical protein
MLLLATTSCNQDGTTATIVGFAVLAAVVGSIIWLAIGWSNARMRAARAEAELAWLRSAYERSVGSPVPPRPPTTWR